MTTRPHKTIVACIVALLALGRVGMAPDGAEGGEPSWMAHIRAMDAALVARDVKTADWAWHEAYSSALGSRTWEGMLAVGQAYLRIGQATGSRTAATARARRAYLAALVRARAQGAVEGTLLVAQAFADLGDRDMADQCLRVAQTLADRSKDAASVARVQLFRAGLISSLRTEKSFDSMLDALRSAEERGGP